MTFWTTIVRSSLRLATDNIVTSAQYQQASFTDFNIDTVSRCFCGLQPAIYPEVDAGRIDWYDVHPSSVYRLERTQILSVALQHANGIYSKPEWGRGPAISEDWAAFIDETVMRGRTARDAAEAVPHVDVSKKKRLAR